MQDAVEGGIWAQSSRVALLIMAVPVCDDIRPRGWASEKKDACNPQTLGRGESVSIAASCKIAGW